MIIAKAATNCFKNVILSEAKHLCLQSARLFGRKKTLPQSDMMFSR